MHKLKYYSIIVLILAVLACTTPVLASVLTNFSDGTTSGNFTYTTGTEWYTRALNIPSGSTATNAYIYLTGYLSDYFFIYNITSYGINTTPYNYRGQFINGTNYNDPGILNKDRANDGNWNNYASINTGTNEGGNLKYYYINYTILQYYYHNITANFNGQGLIKFACKDYTGAFNNWFNSEINPTSSTNITSQIPYSCTNYTTNLQLYMQCWNCFNEMRIYDVEVERTNQSYPRNVTLILNNQSVIFNYGSANGSSLNHKVLANITSYFSSVNGFPQNISFRSNTSGILEFSEIYAAYTVFSNITIFTELNKTVYKGSNVSVNIINGAGTTISYWTTNGSVLFSNPNVSGISTIEFFDSSTQIVPRRFYFNNLETSALNISLYVINSTNVSQVLFTLYRENGDILPGYYMAVLRKWLPDNSFYQVEMHKTDDNGQALLNVKLYDQLYKIRVYDAAMNLMYETGETEIKSTAITLTVNIAEDNWESLQGIVGVQYSQITFNAATSQLTTSYIDGSGILNYTIFKTIRRTMLGDVTVCNNITFGPVANLYCTIDLTQAGSFYSSLIIETKTNNSPYMVSSLWYRKTNTDMGKTGVLMTVIIMLALVALGLYNPAVAIVLALAGFGISVMLGLIYVSIGGVLVVTILGFMIVMKMRT
jgi:hypothetical protein